MNELEEIKIENLIYEIRGKQVMLDSDLFHDRFIIIDNTLYHLGASLKDLGKKYFAIKKIESLDSFNKIMEIVNEWIRRNKNRKLNL